MPWRLAEVPHEVFGRNPRELTVIELRYSPILQVIERQADLQDRHRDRFPDLVERQETHFASSATDGPTVLQQI